MKSPISIFLVGLLLGILLAIFSAKSGDEKIDKSSKIVQSSPLPNIPSHCLTSTQEELTIQQLAFDTLQNSIEHQIYTLKIGATKFFAHGMYREDNNKSVSVCIDASYYKNIDNLFNLHNALRHKLVEYELNLIEKMPNISKYTSSKVANIAFSKKKDIYLVDSIFENEKIDLRPKARMILSKHPEIAHEYAEQAFLEISSNDRLGTSAALISSSGKHKNSIDKINYLLSGILESEKDIITYRNYARFMELAYALTLSEDNAEDYSDSLIEILSREVESAAPPFGTITLKPKYICNILSSNKNNKKLLSSYDFCLDKDYPLAQIPDHLIN